jgi:hypothetical protein
MHSQRGNYVLEMIDSYGLRRSAAAAVEVHVFRMKSLQVDTCILSLFAYARVSNFSLSIVLESKVFWVEMPRSS